MFLCCAAGAAVKTFELSSESIRPQRTLNSLSADITCVRYNHNGRILASSSVDGGICLDVANSGELLSRFFSPGDTIAERRVNAVQFSSGSRFLASGGSDGCIRVWDLKTQEITQTYNISTSAITCVSFSGYKDEYIIGGSASGAISVCDVQTTETAGFLTVDPAHGVHKVTAIQASPHPYARHTLGATYSDGSVRVWDLSTGQLTVEFVKQHDAPATSLALSPVSKVLLVTGGLDGRVIFFDTQQRKELRSLDLEQPVSSLALCADGKTLAVGTTTGEVLVYDLRGVITPLYSTLVHETSAVHSLQFAVPSADAAASSVLPEGLPVVSAQRLSPSKGETLQEIALRKLETLGLNNSTEKNCQDARAPLSPLSSPPQFATRPPEPPSSMAPLTRPNELSLPPPEGFLQPFTPKPSSQNSDVTSFPQHGGDYRQSERSPVSFLSTLSQQTVDDETDRRLSLSESDISRRYSAGECEAMSNAEDTPLPEPRRAVQSPMRAEIRRLREEMELRRGEELDQLSTLLETLMDRFDAIVEENRSLRRENDWLKSHVPAT